MAKVILISQFPLPYSKIGSWTTMYNNYLKNDHQVDYIICNKPDALLNSVKYQFVAEGIVFKFKGNILKHYYLGYLDALKNILNSDEKYIIQIVDNFGIVKSLHDFLVRYGFRNNCQIQFFYHGFPPFYGNFASRFFYEAIDEMVLLTHDSYIVHRDYYTVLPTRFSVLHNGIDTDKFREVSLKQKLLMKSEMNLKDKKIFIWCSKDLPKKGLGLILDVWKKVYSNNKDIVLLVVGANRGIPIDGVHFLGKIPNDDLPKYYQVSDCYLFPTLCHEGFGLSLIEALHSGCYCIASALGGVPEVLQYGKLGKLIERPHFISEWEIAIHDFLEGNFEIPKISNELYSTRSWNIGMNKIIENAKKRF